MRTIIVQDTEGRESLSIDGTEAPEAVAGKYLEIKKLLWPPVTEETEVKKAIKEGTKE